MNRHWLLPAGQVLPTAPLMLVALVAVLAAAAAADPGSWLPSLTRRAPHPAAGAALQAVLARAGELARTDQPAAGLRHHSQERSSR